MSEKLTEAEREALDNAMPAVVEGTEGWEWGVLYRAVEAILAARLSRVEALAAAWDEGALRAAPELGPNGSEWLKRNNPYRAALRMEACDVFGSHPIGGHAQMVLTATHGPDWSDSLPNEPSSCRCGFNGTPEECASYRAVLRSDAHTEQKGEGE